MRTLDPVAIECLHCKRPFHLPKWRINRSGRSLGGKFCSRQCKDMGMRILLSVTCQICGKEFRAQSRSQNAKFCSRECYATAKARPPYQCSRCGLTKTPSDFTKSNTIKRGHNSICRACASIHNKKFNDYPTSREQHFKHNAKRRGFEWDLSHEQFMSFWQASCHYCGSSIATIGLDRVDSKQGYTLSNVRSCCALCNRMKAALPLTTFLAHCHRIAAKFPLYS